MPDHSPHPSGRAAGLASAGRRFAVTVGLLVALVSLLTFVVVAAGTTSLTEAGGGRTPFVDARPGGPGAGPPVVVTPRRTPPAGHQPSATDGPRRVAPKGHDGVPVTAGEPPRHGEAQQPEGALAWPRGKTRATVPPRREPAPHRPPKVVIPRPPKVAPRPPKVVVPKPPKVVVPRPPVMVPEPPVDPCAHGTWRWDKPGWGQPKRWPRDHGRRGDRRGDYGRSMGGYNRVAGPRR